MRKFLLLSVFFFFISWICPDQTRDLAWPGLVTSLYNSHSQFPVKVKPRVTMSFLRVPTFPPEHLTSTTNWLTCHFRSWISRTPTRESSCWSWWPPRRRPSGSWAPAPPSPWRWRTWTTTVQCLTWTPTPRPSQKILSQVIVFSLLLSLLGEIVKYFGIWDYQLRILSSLLNPPTVLVWETERQFAFLVNHTTR